MTRSFTVQSFVDARLIADLVRFFNEEDVPHKTSYSHVVNSVLLAAHRDWDCRYFNKTEEALSYLAFNGFSISQMKTEGRGEKVLRALNKEALMDDAAEASGSVRADEISTMFGEDDKDD